MNIRVMIMVLFASINMMSVAQTLKFKNKTNDRLLVAVGSREMKPYKVPFVKTTAGMNKVDAGKEITIDKVVDNDRYPWVMFWKDGDSKTTYVYEIIDAGKKNLAVQAVIDGGKMALSSVPFTWNTITKDNIVSQGTIDLDREAKLSEIGAKSIK